MGCSRGPKGLFEGFRDRLGVIFDGGFVQVFNYDAGFGFCFGVSDQNLVFIVEFMFYLFD